MALRRIFARVGRCDWGRDGGFFSFPLSSSRDHGRGLGLRLVRGFVRRCIGTSVCSGLDAMMCHIDNAVNIPVECILYPKPLRLFSL